MACAGLKACEIGIPESILSIEKTKRSIKLAMEMSSYAKQQSWGDEGKPLIVKIGIHYGRVIAGVIGHHKPQFSLIGDTVNTTSRVCSTGEDGKITISEEAYRNVRDSEFYFREKIAYV